MTTAGSLKQKAISGMMWTAVQKYSMLLINFISDIILARLLDPYDFGCIEMLAVFMLLAEAFVNSGFGSALIQKKHPSETDYSTVFIWNIGMAAVMYLVLFLCAPSIATFYNIPLLMSILRVQGLVLFVYAFNIIQINILKKKLNFRTIAIVTLVAQVIALSVTIIMAYKGLGVWSLVAKNLLAAGLTSLMLWFLVKWRPTWVFSLHSFKELFSFGFYMFLTHLITQFSVKVQSLLIGKLYSPSVIGYYSKASSLEGMASLSVSQVMEQVTYPLYAEVQDNKEVLSNMVKRLTTSLAYITFPLMFILLLLARPLFILLYTEKWLQSVPYFQFLCLAGLAQCRQSVNMQTISAIGKSKTTFIWTFIKRSVGIGLIIFGLVFWGMKGLLAGAVLNNWFAYFVNMGLVSRYIGYKWYRQLLDLSPILIVAVLSTGISYGIGALTGCSLYIDALIKLFLFLFVYMGWSLIFKPEAYTYCLDILGRLWNRLRLFNRVN